LLLSVGEPGCGPDGWPGADGAGRSAWFAGDRDWRAGVIMAPAVPKIMDLLKDA